MLYLSLPSFYSCNSFIITTINNSFAAGTDLTSLSIEKIPPVHPFGMDNGPNAFNYALESTRAALDMPLHIAKPTGMPYTIVSCSTILKHCIVAQT